MLWLFMRFKHGGNIFFYSNKLNLSEDEILDFSVNLNPLSFPESLKNTISENIDKIYYYPEISGDTLRSRIAEKINCSPENILLGNGSTQIIYLLPVALNIKKAVIIQPTFSEYEKGLKRVNAKIFNYQLKEIDNFTLNIDSLLKKLNTLDFDALYFCNPSNPVGNMLEREKLIYLADYLRKADKIFVLDEAFIDFTKEKGMLEKNFKKCIILRSLTKIFGIAGLRIGYCKSDIKTIVQLKKNIEPWSLNCFSLIAGEELLKKEDFIEKTNFFVEKERNYIVKEISTIKNIKVFDSQTNYLFLKILTKNSVKELENFLIDKNILIRNCSNFRGLNDKFFRVGIKKRKENKILTDNLKEFFRKGK